MYTAISHTQHYNHQCDFDTIDEFEDWCEKNEAIWAHLFDIENARRVATYTDTQGLTHVV